MKLNKKLGLGTVQFGLNYGINNISGIPSDEELDKILVHFYTASADPLIDTATAYGNSQERLGVGLVNNAFDHIKIVSKFSPGVKTGKEVRKELESTLDKLRVKSLYSFMAHNADNLFNNKTVIEELLLAKSEGLIEKVGISLYFPSQLRYILDNRIPIDLIQAPFNVFDQRFSEVFTDAKQSGIEIHIRSAFMQGLIFKPITFFVDYFAPFAKGMHLLQNLSKSYHLSISNIALGFCMAQTEVDRVIIGVDNLNNLSDNFAASQLFESNLPEYIKLTQIAELRDLPEDILLPFNWPK